MCVSSVMIAAVARRARGRAARRLRAAAALQRGERSAARGERASVSAVRHRVQRAGAACGVAHVMLRVDGPISAFATSAIASSAAIKYIVEL